MLPRAPSVNPQAEISSMLHDFVKDLERHLEGVPDEDGLLQAIRPAQERFRRSIRQTAPNFRPFERVHDGEQHLHRAAFLVQEEGQAWEGEDSEDELTDDKKGVEGAGTATGAPRREGVSMDSDDSEDDDDDDSDDDEDDDDDDEEASSEVVEPQPIARPTKSLKRKRSADGSNKIFIDEVAARANRWVFVLSSLCLCYIR